MPINFPTALTAGQEYSYNETTWYWTGSAWAIKATVNPYNVVNTFNGATGNVTGTSVPKHWMM